MQLELLCPACGLRQVDFDSYESMILLAPNLALMQFKCDSCNLNLSVTVKLNPSLQRLVQQRVAQQEDTVTQSPGSVSYASYLVVNEDADNLQIFHPLHVGNSEAKAHIEYFKRQLEVVDTVDDAIEEIDAGYYGKERDI